MTDRPDFERLVELIDEHIDGLFFGSPDLRGIVVDDDAWKNRATRRLEKRRASL